MPRSQTAVEFITTYSFALAVISIALLVGIIIASTQRGSINIFSSCNIQPLLPCDQAVTTYDAAGQSTNFTILFRNQINYVLEFPINSINLTTTGIGSSGVRHTFGSCTPTLAAPGAQIVCTAKIIGPVAPRLGSTIFTPFALKYYLCPNSNTLECSSNLYNSTGYSTETLSGPTTGLYKVTIVANNAVVSINGVQYYSGSSAYFAGGNYLLYAQPTTGSPFVSWYPPPTPSNIIPGDQQSAVLILKSSGTIIATFAPAAPPPTTTVCVGYYC